MLIAIEGIDATGKKTQSAMLKERAEREGLTAATMSFPRYQGSRYSAALAKYLNGGFGTLEQLPPQFPALLFALDRFEARDELNELRANNDLVILDRYVASNLAYQGGRLQPGSEQDELIEWLAGVEYDGMSLPEADLTIYMEMPEKNAKELLGTGRERTYTDEAADLHEKDRGYLAQCRAVYELLADRNVRSDWRRIVCCGGDGKLSEAPAIGDAIWDVIAPELAARASV